MLFQYSAEHPGPVTMVICQAPSFFAEAAFAREQPLVVVLDRRMRIAATVETGDDRASVTRSLPHIAALPSETAQDSIMPAPALMIHNLIDRAFCRALIGEFEKGEVFHNGTSIMPRRTLHSGSSPSRSTSMSASTRAAICCSPNSARTRSDRQPDRR